MSIEMSATKEQAEGRQRQLKLWFYLAVPLLIGFFLGWTQVGRTADWPKYAALIYWFGVTFGSLFFLELLTPPFASILRPRGVPLWVTLIVAQVVIGWIAILPAMRLYTDVVQSFLPAALAGPLQDGSLQTILQKLPTNAVCWLSVNLLFFYAFGMSRFGYQPPARQSVATTEGTVTTNGDAAPPEEAKQEAVQPEAVGSPVFLSKVRDDRQGALLALKAEGHYLHVYTDIGSDMVLCRFSDALVELSESDGMRVHRSWWVAERAVESDKNGEKLVLVNGLEVPVSRSYRVQVRERGWLR